MRVRCFHQLLVRSQQQVGASALYPLDTPRYFAVLHGVYAVVLNYVLNLKHQLADHRCGLTFELSLLKLLANHCFGQRPAFEPRKV